MADLKDPEILAIVNTVAELAARVKALENLLLHDGVIGKGHLDEELKKTRAAAEAGLPHSITDLPVRLKRS